MTVHENKADEIRNAQDIADKMGFGLKIIKINKDYVQKELLNVIRLIESSDPVKVEVGLTMYFALKEAKKDNIKVIFSGVGADDIFAGYKRMRAHANVNEDSLSNLRRIYERDLYRDDVLSMANNIELRLPYLDKELVKYVLQIPSKYKISEIPKSLLRDIALELGFPRELSQLKRSAAQYSSGVNKIMTEITKKEHKGKFLSKYQKNLRLGVLFSSGKDSCYALHIQNRLNYEIACLISVDSKNKDSFMFHTPAVNFAKYQAEALNLPIIIQKTKGKKEEELDDLKKAIAKAKEKYKIQGIVTGAIFSNYQRSRIENICDELNLKVYSPLWHMDQEIEMRNLIKEGYEFILTKIAADGLDKSWLGKRINLNHLDKLIQLNKKNGINIAGEGGEFESFVLDAPLFKKRLQIISSDIIEHSKNSAELIIKKLRFVNKKA